MKKISILLTALIFSLNISAQLVSNTSSNHAQFQVMKQGGTKYLDTLWGPVFNLVDACNKVPKYYSIKPYGGKGYLTGNGSYGTFKMTDCSQGIDNSTSGTINGAIAVIKKVSGSSGNIIAKVYAVNQSTLQPTGTPLGTSNAVSMSSLTVGVHNVPFTFPSPVSVTGDFAIVITYPTPSTDTIVVAQTDFGCVNNTKDYYAYVNLTTVGWNSYKALMSGITPPMQSFDLFIGAIKNTLTDIQENPINATFSLYPNPVNNKVTIACLDKILNVKVLNCIGQLLVNKEVNNNLYNLNTTELNNGMYILQIETTKGFAARKINVSR